MKDAYLVTGASSGIGRFLSLELVNSGFSVIALSRESKHLASLGEELKLVDSNSMAIACDLSSSNDIAKASIAILESYQELSGIVHNAGVIDPIKPISEANFEDWNYLMNVNLIGVQDLTQRLYSLISGEKHTRVSTISSGASKYPIGSWSAYCVSKAGLDMWTRCLAEEGQERNISAISVAPGIVDTNMQKNIRSSNPNDFPLHPHFVDYHKSGQLVTPEEVAKQLLDLVTNHTMEQTGERFDVRDL
ncbi:MAG: SDR family NAD(P)-dependent oxidoreductase [Candidatus Poseidoniaceae archaeon]|nr:SDR family NAD(P)-dependent oxidoreductase [Candidatus Poseidoniaceae archaeon]